MGQRPGEFERYAHSARLSKIVTCFDTWVLWDEVLVGLFVDGSVRMCFVRVSSVRRCFVRVGSVRRFFARAGSARWFCRLL